MGWRKKMGAIQENEHLKLYPQKEQKEQKTINKSEKESFATIATIALNNQEVQTPYQKQYDSLWRKAWALADWIDDSVSDVPWQERAARVPELQEMSMMLSELEVLIKQDKGRTIS